MFFLLVKIFSPYRFGTQDLFLRCLLRLLNYSMRSYDQRLFFSIPKCEHPIAVSLVQSPEFPNLSPFQFLKQLLIAYSTLHLIIVIYNLCSHFLW